VPKAEHDDLQLWCAGPLRLSIPFAALADAGGARGAAKLRSAAVSMGNAHDEMARYIAGADRGCIYRL
jgi:hypothetical protein